MTTAHEPLQLEALVAEGAAEEAVRSLSALASRRRRAARLAVLIAVFGGLAALTREPAVLLGVPAVVALVWVLGSKFWLRQMNTIQLRPGSAIRVEWREHELVVHRPVSSVHFAYDGMELAGTTDHLTALWVGDGDSRRRKVLHLPTALVPPDAIARFRRGGAQGEDPFGAAQMPRTFQVPFGWPVPVRTVHPDGVAVVRGLWVCVALGVAAFAVARLWVPVVVVVGVVAFLYWLTRSPFRKARRLLPEGALVGLALTDARIELALPDRRIDVPRSRLRKVIPAGPDVVELLIQGGTTGMLQIPRALLSDDEIDGLRAAAGQRPLNAYERIN